MVFSLRRAVAVAAVSLAAATGPAHAGEDAPAPARSKAPSRQDRAWTVSVGTGAGGLVELSDALGGDAPADLAGYATARSGRLQANARVDRERGRWVRTGLAYTHQRWTNEYFSAGGAPRGSLQDTVHVLVADLTVRWVRSRDAEVYTGVAAGGGLWRERGTVAGIRRDDEEAGFAFQLRALGLLLGGERLRAFVEVGVGFEGLLLGGVALRI